MSRTHHAARSRGLDSVPSRILSACLLPDETQTCLLFTPGSKLVASFVPRIDLLERACWQEHAEGQPPAQRQQHKRQRRPGGQGGFGRRVRGAGPQPARGIKRYAVVQSENSLFKGADGG